MATVQPEKASGGKGTRVQSRPTRHHKTKASRTTLPSESIVVFRSEKTGDLQFNTLDQFRDSGSICIVVEDEAGNSRLLRRVNLRQQLNGFGWHSTMTPAGPSWQDHILGFFIQHDNLSFAVICSWWGQRLVLSCHAEDGETVALPPEEVVDEAQREAVMIGLRAMLKEWEIDHNQYKSRDWFDAKPSKQLFRYATFPHHAGLLRLTEAADLLRKLEEIPGCGRRVSTGPFVFKENSVRLTAQMALRRMNMVPIRRVPIELEQIRKGEQLLLSLPQTEQPTGILHTRVVQLKKGMSVNDLLQVLGVPDYVDKNDQDRYFWRYEVDVLETPYTLLLWLDDTAANLDRAVIYEPAFWNRQSLFIARQKPSTQYRFLGAGCLDVIGPNGGTVNANTIQLEDGSFQGRQFGLRI